MSDRRTYPLEPIRADGWFARLATQGDHVKQLADAIGEHVLAFSIIVVVDDIIIVVIEKVILRLIHNGCKVGRIGHFIFITTLVPYPKIQQNDARK